jgi:hypothetical protein
MNQPKNPLHRRTVLAGAGGVGALAAAAAVLPAAQPPSPARKVTAQSAAEGAAGYRLSEHVKRYYATTRV